MTATTIKGKEPSETIMGRFSGKMIFGLAASIAIAAAPWLVGNPYQLHVASLVCVYWILISGLNLVVGYSGQLSIGHVGLLAIGAYSYAILTTSASLSPFVALATAGLVGGLCGLLVGLPSLRLPGFYFAMVTLAFALIVNELAFGASWLTGGGAGIAVPPLSTELDSPRAFYLTVLALAALATLLTWNIARSMWGHGLVALRDSEVAAAAMGISVYSLKLVIFAASGVFAGFAGGLFAVLQTYISPETFVFDISLFFFVSIIIGGQGRILGPLLGTLILTLLPEMVSKYAQFSSLIYGVLLLLVVLLVPEGISRVVDRMVAWMKPRPSRGHRIEPNATRLLSVLKAGDES